MAIKAYQKLALDWQPKDESERDFHLIAAAVLLCIFLLAAALSFIDVPTPERRERAPVPERIAKFISQQVKPPPPVQAPQPKPEPKPIPKVETKPTVERQRPSEVEQKPLTESQQQARETAQQSGLLALASELNELMDSSEASTQVSGRLTDQAAGANTIAGHDANIITSGVAQGGGGVGSSTYGSATSNTQLDAREVAKLGSGLFAESEEKKLAANSKAGGRSGNGRAEEDVTIVFDRNKGSLYSLYERERRKTPGLQGKIVLQITIAPNGDVTDVKVVSSELNNPSLEARLVSRIKQFKFESTDLDPVTVTYPIEFLPS